MSTFSKRNTFTALTVAESSEVNENFDDIAAFLNANVVHVDGSKALTGILTGPAADPVGDNDLARKKYVDDTVDDAISSTTFNADKITAGTLPIARGGTGGATAAAARTSLGIVAGTATVTLSGTSYAQTAVPVAGLTTSSRVIACARYSANGSVGCNVVSISNGSFVVRGWTNSNDPATIAFAIEYIAIL